MKIAIIGGLGFVGGHLLDQLNGQGLDITVIARRNIGVLTDARPGISFQSEITPADIGSFDVVINLSYADSYLRKTVFKANKNTLQQIKELLRQDGYLIHASTLCIFGYLLDIPPYPGYLPFRRDYMYVESKLHMEVLVKKHIPMAHIVRIGNIWGCGSPWLHKLADRIIYKKPFPLQAMTAPSNVTDVRNLVHFIDSLLKVRPNAVDYHHIAEFSGVPWIAFIQKILNPLNETAEFTPIILDYPGSFTKEIRNYFSIFSPSGLIFRMLEGRKLYSFGKSLIAKIPGKYRGGKAISINVNKTKDASDFVFGGTVCFDTYTTINWKPPYSFEDSMDSSIKWLQEAGYCLSGVSTD